MHIALGIFFSRFFNPKTKTQFWFYTIGYLLSLFLIFGIFIIGTMESADFVPVARFYAAGGLPGWIAFDYSMDKKSGLFQKRKK
ncbi:MAG TPA: hypothetical protein DIW47_15000 [Bacteroidetes bacterium]|nr:hypothetical protein [Bacteroidota bacterium]